MTYVRRGVEYLTTDEARVYTAVASRGKARSCNTSQVAAEVGLSRATVARITDGLRARGYLVNASQNSAYKWRVTGKPVKDTADYEAARAAEITTCYCGKTVTAGPGVPAGTTCPRCEVRDCTACGGDGWLPSLPEGKSECPCCVGGKIVVRRRP
jgi:hypothetical protein